MSNLQSSASKAQMIELLNSIKIPILGAGGGFAPIGFYSWSADYVTGAPQGWLRCEGQEVNIADYPELATFYASQHGASNYWGGDGITTFAVPDLRGEFIRGAGTNSHTNQGDGANVGVHQDGTVFPSYESDLSKNMGMTVGRITSTDKDISSTNHKWVYREGINVDVAGADYFDEYHTSRPTNTSGVFFVKATVSGDANAHQYSTEEQVVGRWIDGKPIYEKTIIGLNIVPSSGWQVLLDINTLSPEKLIDIKLYNEYNSIVYTMKTPDVIQVEDGKIKSYNIVSTGGNINIITIQYTKTQ